MYDQNRFSRHPIFLIFRDRELEKQYHENFKEIHIVWGRIAIFLGVLLYSGFIVLDNIIMPDTLSSQVIIRLFFVTPYLSVSLLIMFHRRFYLRNMQTMMLLCVLVAGLGHFAMALLSRASAVYLMGTTAIVLYFAYTFTALRFKYSLPVGMFLVVCYEITEIYFMNRSMVDIIFNNFFLLSMNSVGIFSSYTIDRLQGISFIQNLLINEEKKRTEEFYEKVLIQKDQLDESKRTLEAAYKTISSSEKTYRSIFENTGNATVIIEDDSTISLANDEFVKLMGMTKEEIEGKRKWMEFILEEDKIRMIDYHRIRREEGGAAPKNYEFRMVDSRGAVHDIYLTIDVIQGTKKSVASALDITERKRAEEELREAKETYRGIFDNATQGIFRTSPSGSILTVNKAMADILGYGSPDELMSYVKNLAPDIFADPVKVSEYTNIIIEF